MFRRSFDTLHMRLVLFVVLVMAPAVGLLVYIGFEQREQAAEDVKANALRTTNIITSYQEQMILWTHQVLRHLGSLPSVRSQDAAQCDDAFAELLGQYPSYRGFVAAAPDGTVFCASSENALPGLSQNVATLDWFNRSVEIEKFVVSDVMVDEQSGKAVQMFGLPVYADDGSLLAVIAAGLDVERLNEFATRAQLPPGAVVTLFDRNGTILARYPQADEWVGQTVPDAPLIETILDFQGEGTARLPGLDGTSRLCAFTYLRFNQQGLYLNVGVPSSVAFEEVNQALLRNLGLLGIIVLVEIVVAGIGGRVFILRPIRMLSQATRSVSQGDMDVRLDTSGSMGELRPVARSFNDMVSRLQQHETNLREAEARYRKLVEQIPSVIYTMKLESGQFSYVSPRLQMLLGVEPEVWMQHAERWLDFVHPEDRAVVRSEVAQRRKHGEVRTLEYRLVAQDNRVVWVRDECIVVRDEHGVAQLLQGALSDITEQKEAEEVIREQSETMRELSTPLLHIGDTIMLMPLVGALDSQRAQQMMQTLLKGVEVNGAKIVILDVTGVAVVDSQVANAIIQTEQAVRLLGARVVLTGIRPEVAQAMVGLGLDMGAVHTHSTLQSGIAQVLKR
jgi:PAS domain S-box-containing protein